MSRPTYSTSKQSLWLSQAMAWAVILILSIGAAYNGQAVEFGTIAVPSMVALIVSMLGIHRVTGSMDYRASRDTPAPAPPSAPPYDSRADPVGGAS